MTISATSWSIWGIAAAATAGVILRPFASPEYLWAIVGAALLVLLRLIQPEAAWHGILRGTDVYLFLTGMMLLTELARAEGLFGWLAAHAARHARGSATRLFSLIYTVGTIVTVFLSNDATAVVLTPAVAAIAKTARADNALPYLFICAFIANAASFVLPISNPANLVLYGAHMPPLGAWVQRYTLPSLAAIVTTYALLRWSQRASLRTPLSADIAAPILARSGKFVAGGIAATAFVLLGASVFGFSLGLSTFIAALATAVTVCARAPRSRPFEILGAISWGVLPLVAGLFVLVEAVQRTGITLRLATVMQDIASASATRAGWAAGLALGFGCNLVNNLPAGLIAGVAHLPEPVRTAALIGVDLGPNLSVTGSLATILWLAALRREGITISAWRFLRLGCLVMPPALIAALAADLLFF